MKNLKKLDILCGMLLLAASAHAQGGMDLTRARNHHLVFNVGLGSESSLMSIPAVLVPMALNALTNTDIFDGQVYYTTLSEKYDGDKRKVRNRLKMRFKAIDLFEGLEGNIKLGYRTYSPDFVNGGFYGTVKYELTQWEIKGADMDNYTNQRTTRLQAGGSAFLTLGKMERGDRVTLDAGLRYSIPLSYKGPYGDDTDVMNSGLTSHFEVRIDGPSGDANVGLFAEFNHFNLFKEGKLPAAAIPVYGNKLNAWTVGFTYNYTPQHIFK